MAGITMLPQLRESPDTAKYQMDDESWVFAAVATQNTKSTTAAVRTGVCRGIDTSLCLSLDETGARSSLSGSTIQAVEILRNFCTLWQS
jgi:hypothetical protein